MKKQKLRARLRDLELENEELLAVFDFAWDMTDAVREERDRARGIAVDFEQRIDAALAWHNKRESYGGLELCSECGDRWPCPTARALVVEP